MSDTSKGLNGKLLPELRQIAGGLGIRSTGLKKADLIAAIRAAQGGQQTLDTSARAERPQRESGERKDHVEQQGAQQSAQPARAEEQPARQEKAAKRQKAGKESKGGQDGQSAGAPAEQNQSGRDKQADKQANQSDKQANQSEKQQPQQDKQPAKEQQNQQSQDAGDNEGGSRRNRRRRGRDRNQNAQGGQGGNQGGQSGQGGNQNQGGQGNHGNQGGGRHRGEPDLNILEDDVLAPCAGILDVLDNYAFVRTSGYLPGPDDVYVAMSMVRKHGLRRGDAVAGQVRQPREGERREKFNPLVILDSVNGADPEASRTRPEFSKLTPVSPTERLRLETTPDELTGRVIDLVAPIGKGQRGLILSPEKAGRTGVLHAMADAITANNPEVHLMVVLVDERPEEVTDFERSVRGEVISSTFDRAPGDHTIVAELAIERAQRLVELGHDVVVLCDGVTRLARAYNLSATPSGRVLPGGVDSAAIHPAKRFFGAARAIEDGGSLTIVATAVVDSMSRTDEVIFEEFSGTDNMELRLRREYADKRIFPAVDVLSSGTRREELLMSEEELAISWKLRRELASLDGLVALEQLIERLGATQNNIEFLRQVQQSSVAFTSGK